MWKRKQPEPNLPTRPTRYPDGLALAVEDKVYYVKNGILYRAVSPRAVQSWRFNLIPTSKAAISELKYGGVLGFRDGTLLQDIADGRLYLVSGNKRRHITSPDVFEIYGLRRDDVMLVSHEEVEIHTEGEPLSG